MIMIKQYVLTDTEWLKITEEKMELKKKEKQLEEIIDNARYYINYLEGLKTKTAISHNIIDKDIELVKRIFSINTIDNGVIYKKSILE